MSQVRVRTAPSPTGPLHVGNAYNALFNLAFARRHQGRFLLRIEDTDRTRSRPEYEVRMMEGLRWLGLLWDEGPDVGGPYGPYRQSERLPIYRRHVEELIGQGHAYYCFCTAERLEALRAEQMQRKGRLGYDGHCRELSAEVARSRAQAGEPYVVRMRMPREGTCVVRDLLRDEVTFDYANLDDQVLLKSDGFPTYHLAVVVDDHLMEITHVIRGEEWINSSPKHLLLYEWFGWTAPQHAHLPLLLNPDGSKMSKRRNPTSVEYYRRAGYLGPALLNYLALMAYPPLQAEGEKFSFAELTEAFELDRVNLGGSIFDLKKLDWLNARYIREDLTPSELLDALRGWVLRDEFLAEMIPLLQPRMETLGDFVPKVAFLFARRVDPDPADLVPTKRTAEEVVRVLQTALWALEAAQPWEPQTVEAAVRRVAEHWQWPIREVTVPMIAAVTGQRVGPPLFESMVLLGIDLARMRLIEAINLLGGLSKNAAARLEKEWTARAAG